MVIITINIMVFFWITIIDDFDEICILIMIHKLDSKLISKIKKKKKRKRNKQQQQQQQQRYLSLFVVVKYLAFIFGSHFAYSNIKIEFKLHTKIKDKKFYSTFSTFSFNYSTFNQKKSSNF